MKLYYAKGACSLAVHILLNELKLPFELESVNLKTKVTEKGLDYLTINPKGAVPALLSKDNEILTENAVIHQYLADISQATNFLPPVAEMKRYRVLEWLNYVTTELHKTCSLLFNPKIPVEIKNDVVRPLLKTKLEYTNQALAKNKFLLGEQVTLPDGYLFVVLFWLSKLEVNLAEHPHLLRYYNDMKARPAVQLAMKKEGIEKF